MHFSISFLHVVGRRRRRLVAPSPSLEHRRVVVVVSSSSVRKTSSLFVHENAALIRQLRLADLLGKRCWKSSLCRQGNEKNFFSRKLLREGN